MNFIERVLNIIHYRLIVCIQTVKEWTKAVAQQTFIIKLYKVQTSKSQLQFKHYISLIVNLIENIKLGLIQTIGHSKATYPTFWTLFISLLAREETEPCFFSRRAAFSFAKSLSPILN